MRTDVLEVFAAAAAAYGRGNPLLFIEREETPRLLPRLEGLDVLDLGCGHGHYARLARTLGARRVLALDCAAPMAAAAPRPAVVADAGRLPLGEGSVDVVVASLLLSFVADPRAMLREVARVLRPGGALVASDLHPAASALGWSRSFEDGEGRYRVIDAPPPPLPELRAGLGAAGLEVAAWNEPADRRAAAPRVPAGGAPRLRGAARGPVAGHAQGREGEPIMKSVVLFFPSYYSDEAAPPLALIHLAAPLVERRLRRAHRGLGGERRLRGGRRWPPARAPPAWASAW